MQEDDQNKKEKEKKIACSLVGEAIKKKKKTSKIYWTNKRENEFKCTERRWALFLNILETINAYELEHSRGEAFAYELARHYIDGFLPFCRIRWLCEVFGSLRSWLLAIVIGEEAAGVSGLLVC